MFRVYYHCATCNKAVCGICHKPHSIYRVVGEICNNQRVVFAGERYRYSVRIKGRWIEIRDSRYIEIDKQDGNDLLIKSSVGSLNQSISRTWIDTLMPCGKLGFERLIE